MDYFSFEPINAFCGRKYEKYCHPNKDSIRKESSPLDSIYGGIHEPPGKIATFYIQSPWEECRMQHIHTKCSPTVVRRCRVEAVPTSVTDVFDISILGESDAAGSEQNEPNGSAERYEKGREKSSSFRVSRAAAEISADYILDEDAVYSRDIFTGEHSVQGQDDLAVFDKTPLVEDLRLFIGETILKSFVVIARKESNSKAKKILITKPADNNEQYLLDEIGDRVVSKYRPSYSDFNKFNNLICNDIKEFVLTKDFSGDWGELIYDKIANAVFLRIPASENTIPADSRPTTRHGVDGLD